MNIKQLKTLLAAVETGSFAAAGERVGLSPSAVSLQIKAMEEELGVALFDRIRRPPVPTARGRALADHAIKTLTLFEAAPAVARGELVRETLEIGAVPTALASFLPAGLKRLQARFPGVKIDVRSAGSAALAETLAGGRLDLVVCTRPPTPIPGLEWHAIAVEPFVVLAPAQAEGRDWKELLARYPFIWFNRKTWAGRGIETELAGQGMTVQASMEVDSLEAIVNMVGAGLGVSIVPMCKGKRPFSSRLRHLPFGDPVFTREVGALTNSGGRGDLVIDACIEALQSRA
jgi:DNA-binding transcriptional LysR family regulator